jgi:hypothetical protein
MLAWYPAYRWHERYQGLLKEQKNLKRDEKGKGRKPVWERPKY